MKPRSLIALFSVTAILLSLFVLSVPAKAADARVLGASSILDADTTIGLMEFNPTKLSGTTKDLYAEQSKTGAKDFDINWYLKDEEQGYSEKAVEIIQESIVKNKMSSAQVTSNGMQSSITLIEMAESDFAAVVSNLSETSLFKEDTYNGTKIYSLEYNSDFTNHNTPRKGHQLRAELLTDVNPTWALYTFMYYEGYLVKSTLSDELKTIIDSRSRLSDDAKFKEISTKLDSSSALNLYYDIETIKDKLGMGSFNTNSFALSEEEVFADSMELISAYKAIGVSASQTTKGFTMDMYVSQDSAQIKKLGYDFNNAPEPVLYKYMPTGSVILFTDSTVSAKNIQKSAEMLSQILTPIDKELSDLITKSAGTETAFLVQAPALGNLIPSMTLLAKTSGETNDEIRKNLPKAAELLWTQLLQNQSVTVIDGNNIMLTEDGHSAKLTRSTVTIDGVEAYQFSTNINPKGSKNPYAVIWPSKAFEMTFTFGLMENDVLLISTNPNIQTEYKGDLSKDSKLAKYLKTKSSSVGYLNAPNLLNYFYSVLKMMDDNARADLHNKDTEKIVEAFKDMVQEIGFTGEISNSMIELSMDFNVDLPNPTEIISKLSDVEVFDVSELMDNSTKEFSDVSASDWFGDTVYKLATEGIIDGNSDGTFSPSKPMTRAEFTKLLMKVLEKSGKYNRFDVGVYSRDEDFGTFNDVPQYSWFEEPVYAAYNLKLVNGYNKDSFHPNDELKRDHAAKILVNTIKKYAPEYVTPVNTSERVFKDISAKSMAVEDILLLNKMGILKGDQSGYFKPARTLNKAEGAKILNDLWNILSR